MTLEQGKQTNHQTKTPRLYFSVKLSALFRSPHLVACSGQAKIPWIVAAPNQGQVDSELSGCLLRGFATTLQGGFDATLYASSC